MKVVLINHSDSKGGASVVTMRLMKALRRYGVDARMLVMQKTSDNMCVDELQPAWRRKASFLQECADIYMHNGHDRADLFKVSTATSGMPVHRHPWVVDADAVILSWVNQGMMSLKGVEKIKAPVYWLMHDMWCLTGICHHAGVCERYLGQCGECQYVHKKPSAGDISHATWLRKQKLYASKPITFVPVSQWLGHKCNESRLLARQQVHVIHNAFPIDEFYLQPKRTRQYWSLPKQGKLIAMGAARLDDPIKGLPIAIEALNMLKGKDVAAVFFGELREPNALDALEIPYAHLGAISNDDAKDIYAHAHAVLSSSHYETLPGTLIEGMAAGCVPVSFAQGGQAEIIDHLANGFIAQYPSADSLAEGLQWALEADLSPQALRSDVAARFSEDAVVQQWLKLLNKEL